MSGGWQTREVNRNRIVKLGEDEKKGEVMSFEGLLVAIKEHERFSDQVAYVFKGEDGELYEIAGTTVINDQLRFTDVGKILRLEFTGWVRGKSGRPYKSVVVHLWSGQPTDELLVKYPDYGKVKPQTGIRRSTTVRRDPPPGGQSSRPSTPREATRDDFAGYEDAEDLPF